MKFILICNYINRIIDPIISRCAVFRFAKLPKEKIIERLKFISEQEKLQIPQTQANKFYDALFFVSGGDLRKAINTLQMSVALELLDNLDLNEILKISGFLDDATLEKLIKTLHSKNFEGARKIIITIENLDSRNFLRQIMERLGSLNIEFSNYHKIVAFIGEIDYRISQGADAKIQLLALIGELIRNIKIDT